MTQEMRLVKKELRKFAKEIESFEKRSKMIKIVHKAEICNSLSMQINVPKSGKVVDEMINYIKENCKVEEVGNHSIWFCNYEDNEEQNELKSEFNICVYFSKKLSKTSWQTRGFVL